jgi:hypothetical protein
LVAIANGLKAKKIPTDRGNGEWTATHGDRTPRPEHLNHLPAEVQQNVRPCLMLVFTSQPTIADLAITPAPGQNAPSR